MAFCCSVAFVTVALLTVAVLYSVSAAYVTPSVVLMRLKRNPEPMRSFSFSGFNPDGQMAAFTGAAEYPAFGNYGPYYGPPSSVQDSYGPPPSGAEQPATAVADPKNRHQNSNGDHHRIPQEYVPKPDAPASESKEQYNNSVEQTNDKKHYRGRDGPSSNAEASFNAWFPIMFGVFPNGAGGGQPSNTAGRGNHNQQGDEQQNQGSSLYGGSSGFERSSLGTTVIANSVSNGRSGVATSHAIAYGNPRSSQK